MRKNRSNCRVLTLIVLVIAVLVIMTACSTANKVSESAPARVTDLGVKGTAEPPRVLEPEVITESMTEPQTEPQTMAPTERVVHVATPLNTEGIVPDYAAEMIGRAIWGEAGGVENAAERAAVAWCILNRVDAWDMTIEQVITQPGQFHGYRDAANWGECPEEHLELAEDVLNRWAAEKYDIDYCGRVLPPAYLYFWGDGEHNYFSTEYLGTDYWSWSMTNPYT